jgi:hypothetical protein
MDKFKMQGNNQCWDGFTRETGFDKMESTIQVYIRRQEKIIKVLVSFASLSIIIASIRCHQTISLDPPQWSDVTKQSHWTLLGGPMSPNNLIRAC